MAFSEILMTFSEVVGTVAFAISGASLGVKYRLDIFGVLLLGGVTSLGGGTVRDVLMGRIPPSMFTSYEYLLIAAVTSFAVFAVAYFMRGYEFKSQETVSNMLNIIDALGLGAFVVTGTSLPMSAGYADNPFMCVFMGVLTGVGGGVLRDLMARDIPAVLRKHVYAVAAMAGSILYYCAVLIFNHLGVESFGIPTILCIVVTVTMRIFARKYRWNLPRIKFPQDME